MEAGRKAGAKLIVFAHEAFSLDEIDEALDQLEDSSLALEESMPSKSVCESCRPTRDSRARWNFRLTWRAVFTYLNSGLRGIRR